jgi:hypothetical protein
MVSSDGKDRPAECVAHPWHNLLSLSNAVRSKKGHPARRFANPRTKLTRFISCAHPISDKGKCGGQPESFVAGKWR